MDRMTKRITTKFPKGMEEGIELNSEWGKMDIYTRDEYYDLAEKLAHYEDMAEAGRLIELPCAVGDTVYVVDTHCAGDNTNCNHDCNNCDLYINGVYETLFDIDHANTVGEWVFLTKEEAEAKLKELEGE